ncbi:MAG: hypothetical protein ABTD50_24075 [Polyangiaceae bacterium]
MPPAGLLHAPGALRVAPLAHGLVPRLALPLDRTMLRRSGTPLPVRLSRSLQRVVPGDDVRRTPSAPAADSYGESI